MKTQKKIPNTAAKRGRYYGIPVKARIVQNGPSAICQSGNSYGSTGPTNYGGQRIALPGEKYLAMVVQRQNGEWGYVRVNTHCLDIIGQPTVFTEADTAEMIEIWKRVVLDNAIPWEDSARPETLRIVRYELQVEDCTLSLIGDDQAVNEVLRMSALSKLSDEEARLLGLAHAKTKQSIFYNPNFQKEDQKTMTELAKSSATLTLDTMLSYLNPSS